MPNRSGMRRLAFLLLLSGCIFDSRKDPCKDVPQTGRGALAPQQELRDPNTGICQAFGDPFPCDSQCGPCAETGVDIAQPDWGSCFSQCEGLAEDACVAATGCFAAYTDFPTADQAPKFLGCWQTAPSGPVSTGSCKDLGAQECSRHDNCGAHYVQPANSQASFFYCSDEKVAPPPPVCESLTDETSCKARTDCQPVYKGDNCTCTPTTCSCAILTYMACDTN